MTATTRRTAGRRAATVAIGAAGAVALLAGCAQEVPTPTAEEPFTGPMVTVEQEDAVVADVASVLTEASEERDAKLLKARVTGPALEVRSSQLKVAAERKDDSLVTDIPTDVLRSILPTTQTWPRVSYTITEPTADLEVNRLVAYQQASARDNYRLWAWVQLIPGTTMPNFADPELIGSDAVTPDDDSLAVTPADALAQYADLVTKGTDDSKNAAAFELPSGSQDLVARVQADASSVRENDGFGEADGEYALTFVPQGDLVAVRTSDGGAVVMGALDGNVRIKVEEDGEINPLTETQKALVGDKDATNELYVEYTDQVALYVPPAGSEELMRPLGYSHVAVAADTSIPDKKNTDRKK
ncbi:hypothetical protein ATJ88_2659 [Isoptericola jiangsuensis]|uniref:DUF8094 domain-containing protein n=1 Tax=Isoptericola jiangsuensis TaxID=548579 RepID=A0A2A9EYV7_9MICO|nr:hypothetical protein [Isoptericola jiangsuensis]PFG43943.1 hypothetical protein ATJ88_2659 [Isoptericola jiangsuensis]